MLRFSRGGNRAAQQKAVEEMKKQVGRQIGRSIFMFFFTNPVGLITVVLIVALLAYTVYSVDYQLTEILKQYTALSAKTKDSRSGFDRRLFYISVDSNGNQVINVGYSSEVQEEMAQKKGNKNSGGETPVNKTDTYIEFKFPMTVFYLSDGGSLIQDQCSSYYGLGKENTGSWYINFNWKSGTKQRALWDKIHSGINNSSVYPTYDGMPLTAMTPYFSSNDVGQVVIVTFSNGDEVPMIVVDSKGTGDPYPTWPNASAWDTSTKTTFIGHYYVKKKTLAITEFIANDGQGYAAFNKQFGTRLDSSCTITRVTKGDKNYLQ